MLLALFVVAQLAAHSPAAQVPDSVLAEVRRHVTVLAHDSLGGRGTPSRGLDVAARYVASELARAGLQPRGDDGTFIQHYRVIRSRMVPESSSVTVRGPARATFQLGQAVDWVPVSEPVTGPITGPALLLSGLPDSTQPFGDLDVHGAVVIHLVQMDGERVVAPDWLFAAAARGGVAAWILVVDRPDGWWRTLLAAAGEPRTVVSGMPGVWPFPVLEMRDRSMGELLAELGVPHAGIRPVPAMTPPLARLPGLTVDVDLRERVLSEQTAPNVLALVPGAGDDTSAVIIAAHLDALGIAKPIAGDSIYNGADDNASGVAAALVAARLLAQGPPPARPVLFAFFSGTEAGLLGATYYLGHPVRPPARTVAFVNVEAVGGNLRDSLAVIAYHGPGRDSWVTATGPAAAKLGLTLVEDPWPRRRYWLLGDHGLFGTRGVPTLYLFNGPNGNMHHPSDESDRIHYPTVARTALYLPVLARELAAHPPLTQGANP